MKVVIFGANGKVGSLVTKEALRRGLFVRAFIHGDHQFVPNPKLEIAQGDIYDAESVTSAIKGCDAVISALGSWGTPKKDILTVGMTNIIPAMEANKIKRIVSLTGADSRAPGDKLTIIHRASRTLLNILAKKILADGENHICLLADSQLDWTVVRSPVMNDSGDSSWFQLTETRPLPWQTINRTSVAIAILDCLEKTSHIKQAPFISRHRPN